jgi:hypothetical protein
MPKKNVIRTNDPAKTHRKDSETSFNIASKVKNVKHVEMLSKLSPHIKLQMEELFRHEEKITKQLKIPAQMDLFIKDPLRFFTSSKIELSPLIRKRLESFNPEELLESKKFILPNGQVMKPKIRINIKEK